MEVEDDARMPIAMAGSASDRNPEGQEPSRTAMRSLEMKKGDAFEDSVIRRAREEQQQVDLKDKIASYLPAEDGSWKWESLPNGGKMWTRIFTLPRTSRVYPCDNDGTYFQDGPNHHILDGRRRTLAQDDEGKAWVFDDLEWKTTPTVLTKNERYSRENYYLCFRTEEPGQE